MDEEHCLIVVFLNPYILNIMLRFPLTSKLPAHLTFSFLMTGMLLFGQVFATEFTCFPPTAGGVFRMGLRRHSPVTTCNFSVTIPAGSTPTQKAALIAARINATCSPAFAATSTGADVNVTSPGGIGTKVWFKFGPDATGQKTRIEDDLTPGWWEFWASSPLYTCASPASGFSFDGTSQGTVTLGTSAYVSTINTTPGMTPTAIMTALQADLQNNGVLTTLVNLPGGAAGLYLNVPQNATFVEFAGDDSGVNYTFEMFQPPSTIPTLSQWGLILLGLVILCVGAAVLFQKRRWARG